MRGSVIVVLTGLALASGGCATKYEDRCQVTCDISSTNGKCTEADQQNCLTDCRVSTESLSQPCANCVFDIGSHTYAECDPGGGCFCIKGHAGKVSDTKCVEFCKNG